MKISLAVQIVIGLLLGVFCGLFFGEYCAPLARIGSAFIMLLKMCVLPYMSLSLMHAIGGLSPDLARRLAWRGFQALCIIWVVSLATVYSLWFLFPRGDSSRYYSEPPQTVDTTDLLELFIPVNPFHALANDIVPAVVLFSFLFGLALMGLRRKQVFLDNLRVGIEALAAIAKWVTLLSPVGVFALIAASVGTTPFHQIAKVELYVIGYVLGAVFLTTVIFPLLVGVSTPVSARAFMQELRPALLLSFTTGNTLVSLPHIVSGLERLCQKENLQDDTNDNVVETMVPIAYNFPAAGNLLCFLFLLFLSFFYATHLNLFQHIKMLATGTLVLFGGGASVINGTAFLIDALKLPIDGIGLFMETLPLTRNFQTMVSTSSIAVVSLLTVAMLQGRYKLRKARAISMGIGCFFLLIVTVLSIRMTGIGTSRPQEVFSSLHLMERGSEIIYWEKGEPEPKVDFAEGENALQRIRRTGKIRVGYRSDIPPFAYKNKQRELVGYDIAFAHNLAQALDVTAVFIPFHYDQLVSDLKARRYDIAMSSISVTRDRMREIRFSEPYIANHRSLVVLDHRRKEFSDSERLKQRNDITLVALRASSFVPVIAEQFPLAKLVEIEHFADFLHVEGADALYTSDAEGTTWSMMHPEYTAVIPSPTLGTEFYAFALPAGEDDLIHFVNYWLDIKKLDGFAEEQRKYWVEGEIPTKEPRWSVIRNVLHWVN